MNSSYESNRRHTDNALNAQSIHEALVLLRAARKMLLRTANAFPKPDTHDMRLALRGIAASLQPMDELLRAQWVRWRDASTDAICRMENAKK